MPGMAADTALHLARTSEVETGNMRGPRAVIEYIATGQRHSIVGFGGTDLLEQGNIGGRLCTYGPIRIHGYFLQQYRPVKILMRSALLIALVVDKESNRAGRTNGHGVDDVDIDRRVEVDVEGVKSKCAVDVIGPVNRRRQ